MWAEGATGQEDERPCEERQGDSKGTGCSGRRGKLEEGQSDSEGPSSSTDWGRGLPR